MNDISKLYKHLKGVMESKTFLSCDLARGESPFYICPYAAEDEDAVRKMIGQLIVQLNGQNIRVLKIDLFDLCVEILRPDGDLEWLLENEETTDREDFLEQLCSLLEVESVISEISNRITSQKSDIILFTGIGHCYPFLRAHSVLSGLTSVVTSTPLVMFFPGEYRQLEGSGATLSLQGRKHSDGYYRAFDILNCIF